MLAKIDFSTDLNIVELGPGTGPFTSKLLKKMSLTLNFYLLNSIPILPQKLC